MVGNAGKQLIAIEKISEIVGRKKYVEHGIVSRYIHGAKAGHKGLFGVFKIILLLLLLSLDLGKTVFDFGQLTVVNVDLSLDRVDFVLKGVFKLFLVADVAFKAVYLFLDLGLLAFKLVYLFAVACGAGERKLAEKQVSTSDRVTTKETTVFTSLDLFEFNLEDCIELAPFVS